MMNNEEKQWKIDDVIFQLEDAASGMKEIGNHDNHVDVIYDIIRDLQLELESVNEAVMKEDNEELRAMTREYWQSI